MKIKTCAKALKYLPFVNKYYIAPKNQLYMWKSILVYTTVNVHGTGNRIIIQDDAILYHCHINIFGDNNEIYIGNNAVLKYANLDIEDSGNRMKIGNMTRCAGLISMSCMEGTELHIGENCLLSSGIEIRTGDSHSILDLSGMRQNPSATIIIGNHVWIGQRAMILKGARIEGDSVVAAGAIVTQGNFPRNSLIAGIPARIVKKCISWDRQRI